MHANGFGARQHTAQRRVTEHIAEDVVAKRIESVAGRHLGVQHRSRQGQLAAMLRKHQVVSLDQPVALAIFFNRTALVGADLLNQRIT